LLTVALTAVALVAMPDGALRAQTGTAADGDPARGEKLFGRTGCNGCHQISGIGGQVGPDLTGVFALDLATARPEQKQPTVGDYVRESIINPLAYIVPGFPQPSPMPSAEEFNLSTQDLNDLIAYLESVGAAKPK
jgi:mono/diheme cytochrome c family protein